MFPWDAHIWWGFESDADLILDDERNPFLISMDINNLEDGLVKTLFFHGALDEPSTKNLLVTSSLLLLTLILSTILFLLRWRQSKEEEREMDQFHLANLPEELTPILRKTKRALEEFDLDVTPRSFTRLGFLDQNNYGLAGLENVGPVKTLFQGIDVFPNKECQGHSTPKEDKIEETEMMPCVQDSIFSVDPLDVVATSTEIFPETSSSPTQTSEAEDYSTSNQKKNSSLCRLMKRVTTVLPEKVANIVQNFFGAESHPDSPRRVQYVKPWYDNEERCRSSRELKNTNP